MFYYNSGYAKVNNHFVIKNLSNDASRTVDNPILSIIQNLIVRGNPTIATPFLREKLQLKRSYLHEMDNIRIIQSISSDWGRSIRGDDVNQSYPALTFYEDLHQIFKQNSFLADLFIAECPITKIIPNRKFEKQQVDFYSPLLKLVIEVDGSSHKDREQKKLDQSRDRFFKKNGIDVIRISTVQIKNKDYSDLTSKLREVYKKHRLKIKLFEKYLINPSSYQLHYKLTEIYRFQVLIIELIKGERLRFSDKQWDFAVNTQQQAQSLQLALEDLNKWLEVVGALFNDSISLPNIIVHSSMKKEYICIDNLVGKYWDDSLNDPSIIYIRDEYFEEKNHRVMNSSYIVNYAIKEERHLPSLQYILNVLFGFSSFNAGQIDIIINTLNRNDTVGLLPTGSGKSLTYQMCTFLQSAISFVVAPIKSLMIDQVQNLKKKHFIDCIDYINGDLPSQTASDILNGFTEGKFLFLVISPERFQQEEFRNRIQMIQAKKQFAYAVIDEAHCLSEWGHDFRTSYLTLARTIRRYVPTAIFLALTATASSKVLQDIRNELGISSQNVKTISDFTRKELHFHVVEATKFDKQDKLALLVQEKKNPQHLAPMIVFTQTAGGRNGCFKLSNQLRNQLGLKTDFYSGSKPKDFETQDFAKYKESVQSAFMNNEIDVLVATKAFGMGIDKPDVRTIIHYGIPSSLESYYQEAGRAGRDRSDSDCYILFTKDRLSDNQNDILFGLNTKLAEIEKTTRVLQGDLNSIMYLMKQGLKDVEEETSIICDFYLNYLKGHQRTQISKQDDTEKIIYRLGLLGIVDDWVIDWKTNTIIVDVNDYDESKMKESVFKHIQKYDSTFTEEEKYNNLEFADYLRVYESDTYSTLYKYAYILLKWYNDNVVYSRKQSLKNMYNYVLEFKDSDDFQHKLETYFKRNDDVYLLESTVANPHALNNWWKIYYVETDLKTVPKNETEMKDVSITLSRFLESYKNDPALNLMEGFTSLINKGSLDHESKQRLIQSIKHIATLQDELRKEMLLSIVDVASEFLKQEEKIILSEILITNGFNTVEDQKIVYQSLEDDYSYRQLVKHISSRIKEVRIGGEYPWDN
ncbi:RecQ family ATP-dependent DNA helicase [Risungbinella massiliensis]|uniref:RecQ family ATP-dependent DNA helicase n=1 Tax=Risungbinella massiliensis TaxID=1329796 RepID=UPI0005CBDEEF|nr:RecQ family ATP-dependent DNA helicase [Risungbinella massiliensis]